MIPVKVLAQAKSRLTGMAGQRRSELALAMAADTVAAAARPVTVAAVLVVTDDPGGDRGRGRPRARWCSGRAGGRAQRGAGVRGRLFAATGGRNAAGPGWRATCPRAAGGADRGAGRGGRAGRGVRARRGRDRHDAVRGRALALEFRPQFGPASRDRHLATGAAEIVGPAQLAGLRRDVDTLDDLRAAADIGLGPHTLRALGASLRAGPPDAGAPT